MVQKLSEVLFKASKLLADIGIFSPGMYIKKYYPTVSKNPLLP
jgi:hypothetical protein